MRKIFIVLTAVLLFSSIVLAKDEKKNVKQATPAQAQAATGAITTTKEKEVLITDITNLRNQDLRVGVLGQLLNEEIAKLRDVQTAFCGKYKLDVEKFRQGLYRYDEQQGKFVEVAPAPASAKPQQ
ncbi:MAG: hypothetical protein NT066_03445 [Candidatus Omnitrophica bacterium]|nr:hypothetical protein [Candidatus Omnitrophota bacterium]